MMTKIEMAVFNITREFVDSVKKPMIDRYKKMQENPATATMINTLLDKYTTEQEKADKDEQRSFQNYMSNTDETFLPSLDVCCLIHHKQYKTVIIDILQDKA